VKIDRLDHLVLTVSDLDATVRFFTQLGIFGTGHKALRLVRSRQAFDGVVEAISMSHSRRQAHGIPTCVDDGRKLDRW
jgi:catechol 2,3-dioxygenase-like lactoylglutathione lyase family enzyme